jgi:hypothetical protein
VLASENAPDVGVDDEPLRCSRSRAMQAILGIENGIVRIETWPHSC